VKRNFIIIAVFILLALSILTPIVLRKAMAQTSEAEYVPNSKCKSCHNKLFKTQDGTAHATTFEDVVSAGGEKHGDCLHCHATGYGKPGGFVDAESTPDLAGVTCQSCHGPGSKHIEKGLSKEQRRKTVQRLPNCAECHKPHGKHPNIGDKMLPALEKNLEELKKRIDELEG
jgi:hypothetical protein